MIIIDAIITRVSNKLRLWIPKPEIVESSGWNTVRERKRPQRQTAVCAFHLRSRPSQCSSRTSSNSGT